MPKVSWLDRIRQQLAHPQRRSARSRRHLAEKLEQRDLLSVSSLIVNNRLQVVADGNEAIAVQLDPQVTGRVQVLVDGQPVTTLAAIQASALRAITITAGQGNNLIDLNAVRAADFSYTDPITGDRMPISVDAGNGDDTLFGSQDLNDILFAGDGNDLINVAPAAPISSRQLLRGGDGDDTIHGGTSGDSIQAGDGFDLVLGGAGNDTIDGGDGDDVLNGGDGDDSITGSNGEDDINGEVGADSLDGGSGEDNVSGGDGNDTASGGIGHDNVLGDAGDDSLIGQAGNDVLKGGIGNDALFGRSGVDTLSGDDGDDLLFGEAGDDVINGGAGNDTSFGGGGRDLMDAGVGDDSTRGNGGSDTLSGGSGFDFIDGGEGDDLVTSGASTTQTLMEIVNAQVVEGDQGTVNATFTVNLSFVSADLITVEYVTSSDTATEGLDFLRRSGTLTISPGLTSATISVPVVSDLLDEANEVFAITLSNAVNATIVDGSAQCLIVDDDAPSGTVAPLTALNNATNFLVSESRSLGLHPSDLANFIVTNQYTSADSGVTHIYLQQTYQGLPIVDANINVNVDANGRVISSNSSFVPNLSELQLSALPARTADTLFATLGSKLSEHLSHHEHSHGHFGEIDGEEEEIVEALTLQRTVVADRLQWVKVGDSLELAWTLNATTEEVPGWYDVSVSASTGEILHNSSWISHASYNVFRYDVESPLYAQRTIEVDPHDLTASPFGWHDTDGVAGGEFTDTRGNNVFAQPGRDDIQILFGLGTFGTGTRPDGGANLDFNFPFSQATPASSYTDFATTNLFYINNVVHDVFYQYGFDEASGNFQLNNYGNGGLGNDQVAANAQLAANLGVANNAFMATPPDGINPIMAMFEFNVTNPTRDSDAENAIIIHEFGHGVSNRLTGGPSNANALNALQSSGMGEGWSDYFGLIFSQDATDLADDPRPFGNWVLGQQPNGPGIRRFPYSFDMTVNPLTLGSFNGGFPNNEVHNSGEIWAQVLWDMNWFLINGISSPDCEGNILPGYGFDGDLYNGTGGNNVGLQLVIDGMKLQPANPTFLEARDAILQADQNRYGGANERAIWTAFARRGFGFSADAGVDANSDVVVEAFDMPPELGAVRFDKLSYQPGNLIGIQLCDGDLSTPTVTVTLTTDAGDSENVVLQRQSDLSYTGSLQLLPGSAVSGNGVVDLNSESLTMTVSYLDLNDGDPTTLTAISVSSLATVNTISGDTLVGGEGNDTLQGNTGDDLITGGGGTDLLQGGAGNDTMLGGSGRDTLEGGVGDDVLNGQGASDILDGGLGDDTIVWRGEGSDVANVGDGQDSVAYRGTAVQDIISIGQVGSDLTLTIGTSTLTVDGPDEVVGSPVEAIVFDMLGGNDRVTVNNVQNIGASVIVINGGTGNDNLSADGSQLGLVRLVMNGDDGNDSLTGSLGIDELSGGRGNDTINAGAGDDFINGDDDDDVISAGAGADTVDGGAGVDFITGGDGDDALFGGTGNDSLNGNAGDDLAVGEDGDDILVGEQGNDLLLGETGQDSLSGGSGNDTLDGGRNNDVINGNSGNDKIRGDHGDDLLTGSDGDDTIDGGDGNDTISGGEGADGIRAGDGDDFVNGGNGNDTIVGSDGADTLLGFGGIDILLGGDGDDVLNGHGGTDILSLGEGTNINNDLTATIDESFVLTTDILANLDASN